MISLGLLVLLGFLYYNHINTYYDKSMDKFNEDLIMGDLYYDLDNPSIVYFREDNSKEFKEVKLNADE